MRIIWVMGASFKNNKEVKIRFVAFSPTRIYWLSYLRDRQQHAMLGEASPKSPASQTIYSLHSERDRDTSYRALRIYSCFRKIISYCLLSMLRFPFYMHVLLMIPNFKSRKSSCCKCTNIACTWAHYIGMQIKSDHDYYVLCIFAIFSWKLSRLAILNMSSKWTQ